MVVPLAELSDAVVDLLRGGAGSIKRLSDLAKRPDEVGLAGFAVKLLGERMLETKQMLPLHCANFRWSVVRAS